MTDVNKGTIVDDNVAHDFDEMGEARGPECGKNNNALSLSLRLGLREMNPKLMTSSGVADV